MRSIQKLMSPLRTYTLIRTFSLNLAQPFVSFASAANGLVGAQLALISSSNSVMPALVQFFLTYLKSSAKKLVVIGTLLTGTSWIVLSFVPFNFLFTTTYVALQAFAGVSLFGWYLIMDKVSYTSRGRTLAQYSFYSTLGSLIATLVTGFVVRDNFSLIRIFFLIAGALSLLDVFIALNFDVDSEYRKGKKGKISRELKYFLLITFFFSIVWSLAWPVFPMAQVYIFHMNFLQIAIVNVISGTSTLLLQRKIGALVDRNRKLMMFAGRFALATFPLAYAVSNNVYEIYAANIISGFTNAVGSTAYLSYLYDSSSDVRKSVGIYNAIQGLGYLIGSMIGSIILGYFLTVSGEFGIRLTLLVIAMIRILVAFLFLKLPEV